jgi:hypothetical protein
MKRGEYQTCGWTSSVCSTAEGGYFLAAPDADPYAALVLSAGVMVAAAATSALQTMPPCRARNLGFPGKPGHLQSVLLHELNVSTRGWNHG